MSKRLNQTGLLRVILVLFFTCFSFQSQAAGDDYKDYRVHLDFDDASDILDFMVIRSNRPSTSDIDLSIGEGIGVGTSPSGALKTVGVGTRQIHNDLAAIYTPGGKLSNAGFLLQPGQTVDLKLKFRYIKGAFSPVPRLGLVGLTDLERETNFGSKTNIDLDANILGGRYSHVAVADPDKRPKERFAAIAVDLLTNPKERPKKNLVIKYCSPSQFTEIVSNEEPQFHRNGGWYQYHLSITKLPETGRFEVSATFSLLNKKGTKVQSELATIDSQIINNADLYAQDRLVAGIGLLHSPTNTGVERQYDDFTIKVSSASTVALPEPASLLPLGFGLGLYLLGRRRLRA